MDRHDAYQWGNPQNLSYSTSAGTAVSTSAFLTQTAFVRLAVIGTQSATNGARYAIGKNAVAVATDNYLPMGWVEVVRVGGGDKISVVGNDTTGGVISVSEALT